MRSPGFGGRKEGGEKLPQKLEPVGLSVDRGEVLGPRPKQGRDVKYPITKTALVVEEGEVTGEIPKGAPQYQRLGPARAVSGQFLQHFHRH